MKKYLPDNRGAIALTTIIILGAVILLIVMNVVVGGISARTNAFDSASSEVTFVKTDGCLEEALIQLSRDPLYSGDNYEVDGLNCSVAVSGSTVTVDSSEGNYYQHFIADVQLLPEFAILSFSY